MRVRMRPSASPPRSPASMVNAIAGRIPTASKGIVAIRPIVKLLGLPLTQLRSVKRFLKKLGHC
jgi:hypothetical protein